MSWNKLPDVLKRKQELPRYVRQDGEGGDYVILEVIRVGTTDTGNDSFTIVHVAEGIFKVPKIGWAGLTGAFYLAKGSECWMEGEFWNQDGWEVIDATCPECDGPLLCPPGEYICSKCNELDGDSVT